MDKKIDDYLHLYLGCKVLINNAKYENREDTLTYINNLGDCGGNEYDWLSKDCTLVLRPLFSMTETERLQLAAFERVWPFENILPKILVSHILQLHHSQKSIEITKWLLDRHFDLFSLIPAGLAIDSTTLNPQQDEKQ